MANGSICLLGLPCLFNPCHGFRTDHVMLCPGPSEGHDEKPDNAAGRPEGE